jgi:Transglycosylase-like domain
MPTSVAPVRTSRDARLDAGASTFDHSHTTATALAGDASKVAGGSATPSPTGPTVRPVRRSLALRVMAVLGITAALVGAGSAIRSASAASGDAANSVRAFGGAPDLGPASGLNLNASVLDLAAHPGANGYWLVSADGGVFTFGDAQFFGSTGGMTLKAPVVGIAASRGGNGYWLAALDGGVFSFGNASFKGSLGSMRLNSPILSITATPSGQGYWLAAADGGVFAFGDAKFFGSAAGYRPTSPVVAMAATPSGNGYWLLAADGGVFAFGDAVFHGAAVDPSSPVAGIAASPDGTGYWIVRANGAVHPFGVPDGGELRGSVNPAVGIVARATGGYWVAQGKQPPPPPAPVLTLGQHPFLVCTRAHESDGAGGYRAVNANGTYRGAYQFSRSTWDSTARHAGRFDLVGVDPAAASPPDQDFLALHLYTWQGAAPWGGRCAGH